MSSFINPRRKIHYELKKKYSKINHMSDDDIPYTIEPSQGDGYKITTPHGYIDYRPTDSGNEIWWVESHKKNHGSKLVDLMQIHHPSDTIKWGVTTPSGKVLRDKWHKKHPEIQVDNTPLENQFDPSGNNYGEDEDDYDDYDDYDDDEDDNV